jgi:repressor LexA
MNLCESCAAMVRAQKPITKCQLRVLKAIDSMVSENGYAPSLQEIGNAVGLSSLATVHKHLAALRSKGFVERTFHSSRSVAITKLGLARLKSA